MKTIFIAVNHAFVITQEKFAQAWLCMYVFMYALFYAAGLAVSNLSYPAADVLLPIISPFLYDIKGLVI